MKSRKRELNSRPFAYEATALPLSYSGYILPFKRGKGNLNANNVKNEMLIFLIAVNFKPYF